MRFVTFLLVSAAAAIAAPSYASADEPIVAMSAGVKTQNLRFGGGKIVSQNPVLVTSGSIEYESGLYGRFVSTAGRDERDAELNIGGGAVTKCFGGFRCRVEALYWVLPALDTTHGDAVNLVAEISRSYALADGSALAFAVRLEDLNFLGQPDTELFRANGSYTRTVAGVPVRMFVEYDYNAVRNWSHLPVSISARFQPSWLPEGVSITPSLDLLIPLNERDSRETGVAFGVALGRTWR